MQLKKRGYILFRYWGRQITSFDFCNTWKELKSAHANDLDDKWDLEGRNKIHYFYLNVSTGEYYPLKKWADDINKDDRFLSSDKHTLSTKCF